MNKDKKQKKKEMKELQRQLDEKYGYKPGFMTWMRRHNGFKIMTGIGVGTAMVGGTSMAASGITEGILTVKGADVSESGRKAIKASREIGFGLAEGGLALAGSGALLDYIANNAEEARILEEAKTAYNKEIDEISDDVKLIHSYAEACQQELDK